MLKSDIPAHELEALRPILEPLLTRLRRQAEKLPPQADSALAYLLAADECEAGR